MPGWVKLDFSFGEGENFSENTVKIQSFGVRYTSLGLLINFFLSKMNFLKETLKLKLSLTFGYIYNIQTCSKYIIQNYCG